MPQRPRQNIGRRTNNSSSKRERQLREEEEPVEAAAEEVDNDRQLASQFQHELDALKFYSCTNCHRQQLTPSNQSPICSHCRSNTTKFTAFNNMEVSSVPDELTDLTIVEQMLIARVHPAMRIYKVRANGQDGQFHYKGNIINVEQDINEIASVLPTLPENLKVIIVERQGVFGHIDFKVRREKLQQALIWLKANNPFYFDITISDEALHQLPVNDFVHMRVPCVRENQESPDEIEEDQVEETSVPMIAQSRQSDHVQRLMWPTGTSAPVNEFTRVGYIPMAFPHLFPYGKPDLLDFTRPQKISVYEWCKSLMMHTDTRFARDSRFRFFCLNTIQRHEAISRSTIFARKNEFAGNIQQLTAEVERNPSILHKLLHWCSKIRGTSPYWYQRRMELEAMVTQLGVPTVFLTLSAADLWWPCTQRLLNVTEELIGKTEPQISRIVQREINSNPLIVDIYFAKRVVIFMDILKRKLQVVEFWYRFEYQHRGSPHVHILLWLANAPDVNLFDSYTDEQLVACRLYYDGIVSAINPSPSEPPSRTHPSRLKCTEIDLNDNVQTAQLLNRVQRHTKCSARYCLRNSKCRFNFPKPLQEESSLTKDVNGIWQYTTARNDSLIDEHNPFVAKVWRANTDCKIVASKHTIVNYLAKYTAKSEPHSQTYKDLFHEVLSTTEQDSCAKKAFSKMMIKVVGQRDYSACEVSHLLCSEPLFHSSRQFVKIFIGLEDYVQINNDIDDEFVPTSTLQHYAERSNDLDCLNLLQFATQYHASRGIVRKCRKPRVLQVIPYVDKNQPHQIETYYKQKLALYVPWRISIDTLKTHATWQESVVARNLVLFELPAADIHEDDIDSPELNPHEWEEVAAAVPNQAICNVSLGYRNIDRDFDWYSSFDKYVDIVDQMNLVQLAKEQETTALQLTTEENDQRPMNNDQSCVLTYLQNQLNDDSLNRLVIVQGAAGTGKSFLIHKMVQYMRRNHGENSVLLMAPTGVAANNINGQTIHSALHLTVSRSGIFRDLTGESERNYQQKFENVNVVICDEMSMIGLKLLAGIDQRLRQAKPENQHLVFGNIIVYLFGDFHQLPPVGDSSMLAQANNQNMASVRGKLIFEQFSKVFELKQIMRQTGDSQKAFRDTLKHIGDGNVTQEDYILLSQRFATYIRDHSIFNNTIRIKAKKQDVVEYNEDRLRQLNQPVALIKAKHNNATAELATIDEAQGLSAKLLLSIGCRVMLTKNLWTNKGLCNGALGFVKDIIYSPTENRIPMSEIPLCILVKFDKYNGPTLNEGEIPIVIQSAGFKKSNVSCVRKQFPLKVAYALTIHKAQGITVDQAVVDIGSSEYGLGLSYVGLSRVKTFEGLLLDPPFSLDRLMSINRHGSWAKKKEALDRLHEMSNTHV